MLINVVSMQSYGRRKLRNLIKTVRNLISGDPPDQGGVRGVGGTPLVGWRMGFWKIYTVNVTLWRRYLIWDSRYLFW